MPFEVTGPTTGFRKGAAAFDWVVPSLIERDGCDDTALPKLGWESYVGTCTAVSPADQVAKG